MNLSPICDHSNSLEINWISCEWRPVIAGLSSAHPSVSKARSFRHRSARVAPTPANGEPSQETLFHRALHLKVPCRKPRKPSPLRRPSKPRL